MSTSKTILLVDDDAGLCKLLQTTLTTPEIAIVAASSGEQALTLARQLRPELIILDMHLTPAHPSGLEVCRALKSDPALGRTPIVMLTGAHGPEKRQAAVAAGVDYFYTKPFSPRTLLDQVERILLG
jgi:CheY-like chemotaxis protein